MLDVELTAPTLALLALSAFAAGWVDAIAGGGGVITVPALLAAGLPPHLALGTNKGQAVFGAVTSLARFSRSGLIDLARGRLTFPMGFVGALIGAQLVLLIPSTALKPLVLMLLVGVAVFLTLRPRLANIARTTRVVGRRDLAALLALAIGAYDGFFGPGTGTFLIVAHVLWFDINLTEASANAKVVNFASNLASVVLFALNGTILWAIALPMALANLIGASLGARLAIKNGDRLVRPVVLAVVLLLCSKLAFDLLA